MNRTELLEYVKDLQSRQRSNRNQHGATIWALSVAAFALIWKITPTAQGAIIDGNTDGIIQFISFISPLIFFIFFGIFSFEPTSKPNRNDYRLSISSRHRNSFINFLSILLLCVAPLIACIHSLGSLNHTITIWTTKINIFIYSFFIFIFFYSLYARHKSFKKYGLPPVTEIPIDRNSKFNFYLFSIFKSIIIIVILINSYSIYKSINSDKYYLLGFISAVNITFLIYIISAILMKLGGSSILTGLEKLERDILLYDLSEDEIKERLEEEYLGIEFGKWLSDKIDHLEILATLLNEHSEKLVDLKSEIQNIDPQYNYEIESRINNYMDKYFELSEQYSVEASALVGWIEKIAPNVKLQGDETVKKIISDHARRIKEKHVEVSEMTENMRENVKNLRSDVEVRKSANTAHTV